jgi:serine/threonine protein kinase
LKLKSLHTLKIVHLDIKPENISFSLALNEPVFLDFGFSDILDEDIGMKTQTFFVGTIGYNSPEMMECYNHQCSSFVDVYYNDVYALDKSIQSIL